MDSADGMRKLPGLIPANTKRLDTKVASVVLTSPTDADSMRLLRVAGGPFSVEIATTVDGLGVDANVGCVHGDRMIAAILALAEPSEVEAIADHVDVIRPRQEPRAPQLIDPPHPIFRWACSDEVSRYSMNEPYFDDDGRVAATDGRIAVRTSKRYKSPAEVAKERASNEKFPPVSEVMGNVAGRVEVALADAVKHVKPGGRCPVCMGLGYFYTVPAADDADDFDDDDSIDWVDESGEIRVPSSFGTPCENCGGSGVTRDSVLYNLNPDDPGNPYWMRDRYFDMIVAAGVLTVWIGKDAQARKKHLSALFYSPDGVFEGAAMPIADGPEIEGHNPIKPDDPDEPEPTPDSAPDAPPPQPAEASA